MIEVIGNRRGNQKALVTCDICKVESVEIPAQTDGEKVTNRGNHSTKNPAPIVDGHVMRRLTAKGWTMRGKRHVCPGCQGHGQAEEPKGEVEQDMAEVKLVPAEITRETRRAIRGLLDEVYDVEAQRYRGAETDKTVAETVGGGCLVEWVAAERKDGYGDSGENEAQTGLDANLTHLRAQVNEELEAVGAERAQMLHAVQQLDKLVRDSYGKSLANLNALRDAIDRARKEVGALAKRFPKGL